MGFEDEDDDEYEDDWLGPGFGICYLLFIIAPRCERGALRVA